MQWVTEDASQNFLFISRVTLLLYGHNLAPCSISVQALAASNIIEPGIMNQDYWRLRWWQCGFVDGDPKIFCRGFFFFFLLMLRLACGRGECREEGERKMGTISLMNGWRNTEVEKLRIWEFEERGDQKGAVGSGYGGDGKRRWLISDCVAPLESPGSF